MKFSCIIIARDSIKFFACYSLRNMPCCHINRFINRLYGPIVPVYLQIVKIQGARNEKKKREEENKKNRVTTQTGEEKNEKPVWSGCFTIMILCAYVCWMYVFVLRIVYAVYPIWQVKVERINVIVRLIFFVVFSFFILMIFMYVLVSMYRL